MLQLPVFLEHRAEQLAEIIETDLRRQQLQRLAPSGANRLAPAAAAKVAFSAASRNRRTACASSKCRESDGDSPASSGKRPSTELQNA